MKKLILAAVMLVICMFGTSLSRAEDSSVALLPTQGWYMPPDPKNLAEFLASVPDLAVIGTVQTATESRRGYARVPELMSLPVTEVRMVVNELWFGIAPDDTIEITLLEVGYGLKPGDRLIAWGTYVPEDNWRLRGRGRRIDGDVMQARINESFNECGGRKLDLGSVDSVRYSPAYVNSVSAVFSGNRAVALARLRGSSRWSPSGATYEVDSLGWAIGKGEAVPRLITFPPVPGCSPGIMPGDSLLVPVPPGFNGRNLHLTNCPSSLRIKDGFVPGLGVRLDQVSRAIDASGLMLQLRTLQLKEN